MFFKDIDALKAKVAEATAGTSETNSQIAAYDQNTV